MVLGALGALLVVLTVPAQAASAATASARGTPSVTIGVISPTAGGLTSFGLGIRDSVQLAVTQANDDQSVKGWTVKLRALDDSSDPAKGRADARKLAADRSVVAVIGPYNSGVALEAAPVLAKQGVALVSPSNTLTSLTVGADPAHPKRPWKTYFRMVGPDSQQAQFLARQARALGFTTAAVVSETKAVSLGLANQFADAFVAAGGSVPVHQKVPDGATDFKGFLDAAVAAKPQLLFFGGEYQVAATLRQQATAAGINAPLMGGDGMNDPAYITGAGPSATGSFASGVGAPLNTIPGASEFLGAYQAQSFANPPTDYGPYAYDGTNAVLAVLARTLKGKSALPSDVRAKVVKGLQGVDATGVTGAISFDRYGDTKSPAFTLYKVEGSPAAWTPVP
jgi:branched-chain amino acid transport system substrate-binding protein